jgi:CTP synthase (UTP-ammonia lyase)
VQVGFQGVTRWILPIAGLQEETMKKVHIALIGNFDSSVPAHQAIPRALCLSAERLGISVDPVWTHTSKLGADTSARLDKFNGIWCVPASPYANAEGALAAIRCARKTGRPFLGTCGGFQHALLEYARNVLGRGEADHAETSPDAAMPLISRLSCSLIEQRGKVTFGEGTQLQSIYGAEYAEESYHCNYGLNPEYVTIFHGGALRVAAWDDAGDVRAIELTGHPFFIATLYQPERAALRGAEHPLVTAFVEAAGRGLI